MRGYRVCKTFRFEAAHCLPNHDGKCRREHGHSYRVEVVLFGNELNAEGPKTGMLIDFGDVKKAAKGIVDTHDHALLNGLPEYKAAPPTAEVIARNIHSTLSALIDGAGVVVERVRVYETQDCWAEWSRI